MIPKQIGTLFILTSMLISFRTIKPVSVLVTCTKPSKLSLYQHPDGFPSVTQYYSNGGSDVPLNNTILLKL